MDPVGEENYASIYCFPYLVQHILCDLYMRKMSIYFFLLLQTLIEGAMTGYTENGMKIAQDTLVMLNCL